MPLGWVFHLVASPGPCSCEGYRARAAGVTLGQSAPALQGMAHAPDLVVSRPVRALTWQAMVGSWGWSR